MVSKIKYQFKAAIWKYSSTKGGWYFVTLPVSISEEIRNALKWQEEGWGRLRVRAKINTSEWKTAIWYDTKSKSYLLPLKAEVRKKENLLVDKNIEVFIWI